MCYIEWYLPHYPDKKVIRILKQKLLQYPDILSVYCTWPNNKTSGFQNIVIALYLDISISGQNVQKCLNIRTNRPDIGTECFLCVSWNKVYLYIMYAVRLCYDIRTFCTVIITFTFILVFFLTHVPSNFDCYLVFV